MYRFFNNSRSFFPFLLLSVCGISSCSTDFEVNAPYKEITVVYGLLNQNESEQFIKINKAFLGEEDAYVMAQSPDSINYDPNNLEVSIKEFEKGKNINTYPLTYVPNVPKEAGIFADEKNTIFKLSGVTLKQDNEYHLTVKNIKTGNILTGKTLLVKDFKIFPGGTPTNFSFRKLNGTYNNMDIDWLSAVNGKIYEILMRIRYTEKNLQTGVYTVKTLDWVLPQQTSSSTSGGETMEWTVNGEDFYKFLKNEISVDDNVKRYVRHPDNDTATVEIDFIVNVGNEDLNTYIEVSSPSSGILQDKPDFTNILNGTGLFAARSGEGVFRKKLAVSSETWLKDGDYTRDLFD